MRRPRSPSSRGPYTDASRRGTIAGCNKSALMTKFPAAHAYSCDLGWLMAFGNGNRAFGGAPSTNGFSRLFDLFLRWQILDPVEGKCEGKCEGQFEGESEG